MREISIKLMMNWPNHLRHSLLKNERLSRHTYFKIGGPVEYWFEPLSFAELKNIILLVHKRKIPLFVIGLGSNILADSRGLKGVVIRLNHLNKIKIDAEKNELIAQAGVSLNRIIKAAQDASLSGTEFMIGIPGSLGGALIMNAGISSPYLMSVGDIVKEVVVLDYSGKVRLLKRKDIRFGYRNSSLGKFIILSAVLKLNKGDKQNIRKKINILKKMRVSGKIFYPNAGCVFKNPNLGLSAGKLIDACGLKGASFGDAFVSKQHANFIVNKGCASSGDVLGLMGNIKKEVKKRFNVILKPEIKIWKN